MKSKSILCATVVACFAVGCAVAGPMTPGTAMNVCTTATPGLPPVSASCGGVTFNFTSNLPAVSGGSDLRPMLTLQNLGWAIRSSTQGWVIPDFTTTSIVPTGPNGLWYLEFEVTGSAGAPITGLGFLSINNHTQNSIFAPRYGFGNDTAVPQVATISVAEIACSPLTTSITITTLTNIDSLSCVGGTNYTPGLSSSGVISNANPAQPPVEFFDQRAYVVMALRLTQPLAAGADFQLIVQTPEPATGTMVFLSGVLILALRKARKRAA